MAADGFTLGDLATMKARERRETLFTEPAVGDAPGDEAIERAMATMRGQSAPGAQSTENRYRLPSRYEEAKHRPHVRRVRSPRFFDDEWKRVVNQAARLVSQEGHAWSFMGSRQMSAHEFIRVAAMALVKLLEGIPHGDRPPPIWDVLEDPMFRGALDKRLRELDDARRSSRWGSSARNAHHQARPTSTPAQSKKSPPHPKKKRGSK